MQRLKMLMIRPELGDAGLGVPVVRHKSTNVPRGFPAESCCQPALSDPQYSSSHLWVIGLAIIRRVLRTGHLVSPCVCSRPWGQVTEVWAGEY